MQGKKKWLLAVMAFAAIGLYTIMYYPRQMIRNIGFAGVSTPLFEKYHNDCLHPCIRKDSVRNCFWMVQSPYFKWDSKVENPILYSSDDLDRWDYGVVVAQTPEYGYNSDPCIYLSEDTVFVFWREVGTPLCDSLRAEEAVVGVYTTDGESFTDKKTYLSNADRNTDTEQAPVLIKYNGRYRFYATWYQYEPERKNKGIAIWEGNSLTAPDFRLIDTVNFRAIYTVDKIAQKRFFGKLWFIPKPHKYDLWHFDLVEYDDKLLMVSSSEKGDNIMLSVSEDGVHFKTNHTPLINNHYLENYVRYRQYYYKLLLLKTTHCICSIQPTIPIPL